MSGDCEIAQYYNWKERVARKEHECCECDAKIIPGEKYLQVNACWEHRPDTYRQHLLCARACEYVRDSGINDDECLYYGGLKEWWGEWVGGMNNRDAEEAQRATVWRFMLQITRRERRQRGPIAAGA